ncbi:Ubiquitin family protein [Rhynchospora pubera]|uniref:Ubiquitin family protein n=1 Tax=Rhynchospora pubera TaxID=906938 RepID=A0AAV8GIB7_9POAL|nr:Ubiquitin family protein [Rhynchospora pubera]
MHDTMGSDLEDDEQSEVLLQIQLADQSKITILFNLNKTVEEFRWAVAELTEILPNEQNLVYRGHILENSYTLKSYGLEQDQIIDVVRRVRPPSTSISSDLIIHLGRRGPPLNMSIGFLSRKCGLDNTRNGLSDKKPQLQPILNTAASIIREIPILSQISNEQGMEKMLGNRLTLRKTLWYLLFLKLLKVRKGVASRKADIMRTVKAFSEESERLKRNHVLQGISHQSEANQLSCDLMGLNLVGTSSCVTKSSNANQSCSAPNTKPLPNPWFACSSRGIFLWNEHTSVLSLWQYLKNDSDGRERALDDFVHMLITETSFLRHYKEQHNSIDLAVTAMLGSDYAGVSDILHDADLPYETLGNIASENLLAAQLAEMVRDLLLYGMDMEEAIKKRLGG